MSHKIWVNNISYKKLEQYKDSLSVSMLLERINPRFVKNLLNLADTYRFLHDKENAILYSRKVLEKEPENEIARKILDVVSNQT